MKITFTTFLISLSIIILGGVIYVSIGAHVQAAAPIVADSALVSKNETSLLNESMRDGGDKITADTAFLLKLASLKIMKIDKTIFNNEAFKRLTDNSPTITSTLIQSGRKNPFAPINALEKNKIQAPTSLKTNKPAKIGMTIATLSGTVNNTNSNEGAYFEYGPTALLGQTTPESLPLKEGAFTSNIRALTSKTTYFYRAVTKVNDKPVYGEVVTFETN